MRARTPELEALEDLSVLILGCGALGSMIADALARAGVGHLTLLDNDVLEAGNLVRHAASIDQVGFRKTIAVAAVVAKARPGIDVKVIDARVGGIRDPTIEATDSATAQLTDAIRNSQIVIDATAEIAVHEVVSEMARELFATYIIAEASHGAWGGMVAVFPSDADSCWNCLEFQLQAGSIEGPPSDGTKVQPPGCSEPTFTGAGFDLAEVAIHAARLTAAIAEVAGVVPSVDVVALRDSDGIRRLPEWTHSDVSRDSRCQWHQS